MQKMSCIVIVLLALMVVAAVIAGCRSCIISEKRTDVPTGIADCKLLSYSYSRHGTTRWPLHSERVERCNDDPTRCVIRLFDPSGKSIGERGADGMDSVRMDADGEPLADTLVVSADVLDRVRQMIVEAQAWRFKDHYRPRMEILDGWSWSFSATFELSEAVLAATPEADRPRLLRRGGRQLCSGGGNASPDTDLFEKVREYLVQVMAESR